MANANYLWFGTKLINPSYFRRTISKCLIIQALIIAPFKSEGQLNELTKRVVKAFQLDSPELIKTCYPKSADFEPIAVNIPNAETRAEFLTHYQKRFANKDSVEIDNYRTIEANGAALEAVN